MGFSIRDEAGNLLAQRLPGTKFYATDILATFCIQCVNALRVQMYSPPEDTQQKEQLKQQLVAADTSQ